MTTITAHLTLVTEHQTHRAGAEQLAAMLQQTLGPACSIHSIAPYPKFDQSFKLELEVNLDTTQNTVLQGIVQTDTIVSPWSVYYDTDANTAEMIFNKDQNSRFRQPEFTVIRWGHWRL